MRRSMQVLLVGLFVAAMAEMVQADIIVQHVGSNDPRSEGFTRDLGTAGNAVDDNGTAAWEISAGKTRYISSLSSATVAALQSSTWEVSGTLRNGTIPYSLDQCGIYMELTYGSGTAAKTYGVTIGSRVNPNETIEVQAGSLTDIYTGAYSPVMYVGAFGAGYHQYRIVRDDLTTENVKFYVDDILQGTFAPATGSGTISDLNRFVWGASAFQESWNADARWSGASLTIGSVPEPSTIALMTTGMLGLLAYAWRKRG